MHQDDTVFASLQAFGAGEFKHINGSLFTHLSGTAALLQAWGATDVLCRAGLYHAAYGTDDYEASLITLDRRQAIAELIGAEAEAMVYLYCACDREKYWPRIGTAQQYWFVDRFQQSEYAIDAHQLTRFCELTLANELDIMMHCAEGRAQQDDELIVLFNRMEPHVSRAGFLAYQRHVHRIQ